MFEGEPQPEPEKQKMSPGKAEETLMGILTEMGGRPDNQGEPEQIKGLVEELRNGADPEDVVRRAREVQAQRQD